MANAARLEVEFSFDGKDYSVRPTFELISSIESVTGMGCTALAERFWATDPSQYASLTITSQVLYAILRREDKSITPAVISQVLLDDGCGPLFQPLGEFCARALRGHKEHIRIAEQQEREAQAAREAAQDGTKNPPEKSGTDGAT